jgi:apolipoprotein N-acyltransferase
MTHATKHFAPQRRSEGVMQGTLGARAPSEASRSGVTWPQALAASLVSPALLSLSFPTFDAGIISFIALVPLFLLWSRASWKQAFWWGWLAGAVTSLLLFHWMTTSIGDFVGAWSLLALILLCGYYGLFMAAVAVLTALVCRGDFRALAVFAVPAAWLLVESIRTRGVLGLPFGELGLVAAHLPWLLPLAAYCGVFGLSALVALVNASVAGIIGGTPQAKRVGTIALAAVVLAIVAGDYARNRVVFERPALRVAVAQGNISQREKWTPAVFARTLTTYTDLTRKAAARGAKVVVWPETVVTAFPLQQPVLLSSLESLASQTGVWIMAGTIDRPSSDAYYNALLELTPQGAVGGVYHKRLLVPFAEYLPLDGLLRRLPLMDSASRFVAGPGPHLLSAAGYQWGTLICYESAFAPYARATANAGADALIVATDDAWFGGTGGPYQHADVAVVNAVSTGRWIVRGADTGISEIIDPKGAITARLGLDQQGLVVGDIGHGVTTPYDQFGAAWLLVLSLAVLVIGLVPRREAATGWRSRRGKQ